jgi:signal transduction histidine kinase
LDSESTLDGRRLRALIDAGQLVVSERELASVLDRLLEVARELTGARYAAIGVLDESRTGLADFITAGIDEPTRQAIGELPRGRGLLGTLIREPKPLRLDDVGLHPELRPAALDELGLAPALDALHERATLIHGIEIEAEIDLAYEPGRHPERLDQELETVIYRVVQESLHNAGRHARAKRARVTVQERDAELIVCIGDDGEGFDLSQPTTGFGLAGMRERVTLVGGHLEVFSTSTGTEVQARLPITRVKRKSA